MTDCLRHFILSINQLQLADAPEEPNLKVRRYLRKMDQEWKTGSNERLQSEEAFLKLFSGGRNDL